jgi:hypothetical protein
MVRAERTIAACVRRCWLNGPSSDSYGTRARTISSNGPRSCPYIRHNARQVASHRSDEGNLDGMQRV